LKSLCLKSLNSLCLKSLCLKSLCMKNLKSRCLKSRCVKSKSPKKMRRRTFLKMMIKKLILNANQIKLHEKNRRNIPYMIRMAINLKIIYRLDNSEFFILTIWII
jgi:hypothetical protein